ncbi:MAG: hypothetical protein R3F62_16715 [Planctomycetota bacterium]
MGRDRRGRAREGLTRHALPDGCLVWSARLPAALCLDPPDFADAWRLHPPERHRIRMHGRFRAHPATSSRPTPATHHYTGNVNRALRCLARVRAVPRSGARRPSTRG